MRASKYVRAVKSRFRSAPAWELTRARAREREAQVPWCQLPRFAPTGVSGHAHRCQFPRWRTTEPRFDCANVLRRTHCLVRRSSISSEHDLERSFVSHPNSTRDGETRRDATRRDATTADDYCCSRRPASGGITSHARTQLRLISPRPLARTHARTKRIRFPGWTHPPTSYIYIYMCK